MTNRHWRLTISNSRAETNPNPDMDTGFALTMVGGAMDTLFMVTPGLKETLRGHQNFMASTADTLEVKEGAGQ